MKGSLSNVINLLTLIHPGERKSINLLTLKFVNLSTLARETYQNLTNYCSFKTNPPWREKLIQIYQFIDASIFQLIHPVGRKLSKPYEKLINYWLCYNTVKGNLSKACEAKLIHLSAYLLFHLLTLISTFKLFQLVHPEKRREGYQYFCKINCL